jgi:ribosomal 50S subunit-associated protein YjgA (DUF615 family)
MIKRIASFIIFKCECGREQVGKLTRGGIEPVKVDIEKIEKEAEKKVENLKKVENVKEKDFFDELFGF